MADAIITDINEYRARKGKDVNHFAEYSDDRIKTRYEAVQAYLKLPNPNHPAASGMVASMFPEGFDPIMHPEDHIDKLRAEGVRRGVFAP